MISILQALIILGMVVVGDPMDATGHYGVACSGYPDERILSNAAKLGRRVASLARKLES
jgi:NAD(P)H dehydrogenase (quinone)